jgi:23S rRNA (uracil1939-C5)-methyltransferase
LLSKRNFLSAKNRHTVTITKVVTGGHGLAKLADGLVLMVPFVLPGEVVVVDVQKQRKNFAEAILLEVLKPSPQRVEPACHYFRDCGGCHLQHGDYPSQLAIKEGILHDLLSRNRQWSTAEIGSSYQSILASPVPFHYRQRIRLQADSNGRLGFFERRSHAVVDIVSCPLAADPLNQVLSELRGLAAFRKFMGQAVALELLLSPLSGQVEMIVHLGRKPRPADQQAATSLADQVDLVQAVWLAGEGFAMSGPYGAGAGGGSKSEGIAFALPDDLGGRELILRFEAGGFCQVNHQQNERLVRQLLAWGEVGHGDAVLDLFCGMGNFSLPLALAARQVVGTDLQRSSIRGAQSNALANRLENCLFLRADALAAVRDFKRAQERFDIILLDPPRQGCRDIIPLLADLGAKKIIYISCDPATLVRDLMQLHGLGFGLRKIRAVDMFPQTCHVETIALLSQD